MNYSCFNPKLGMYEYFVDEAGHPMNGDLPVPSFPRGQAGVVGVPALDAGRRLPSGAKRAGTGWHARGMIVTCSNAPTRSLSGFGDVGGFIKEHPVIFLAVSGLAVYGLWSLAVTQLQQMSGGGRL